MLIGSDGKVDSVIVPATVFVGDYTSEWLVELVARKIIIVASPTVLAASLLAAATFRVPALNQHANVHPGCPVKACWENYICASTCASRVSACASCISPSTL